MTKLSFYGIIYAQLKKGFEIMNIEKRILAGLLGISIAAAGIEGVAIKMQNDEINNVRQG